MKKQIDLPGEEISVAPKVETQERIAVIGLGYVGLPLFCAFAEKNFSVLGFDISAEKVSNLSVGIDLSRAVDAERLRALNRNFSSESQDLADATMYFVAVPTPVDSENKPDFGPLIAACRTIGPSLCSGDVVVFESTVYPGATEEICVPALTAASGLQMGSDFHVAYSPERVNPGDEQHKLENIVKVVSASDNPTRQRVADVYQTILDSPIYLAESIKVAEAAKVLENTQRDVNIALMNEFSKICDRLGIETMDVIEAASTKWNFAKFVPGLVGGHCISVDPYYLVEVAAKNGLETPLISSSRSVNESVPAFIAGQVIDSLEARFGESKGHSVAVFGLTFKENVADTRNSKSLELAQILQAQGLAVFVHDPFVASEDSVIAEFQKVTAANCGSLDVAIFATPHDQYFGENGFLEKLAPSAMVFDLKSRIKKDQRSRFGSCWSL